MRNPIKRLLYFLLLIVPAICTAQEDCTPSNFGTWAEKASWREGDFVYAVGISDRKANVSDARYEALLKAENEIRRQIAADEDEILEPETKRTVDCSPEEGKFISIRLIALDATIERRRREIPGAAPKVELSAPSTRGLDWLSLDAAGASPKTHRAPASLPQPEVQTSSASGGGSKAFLFTTQYGTTPVSGSHDLFIEIGTGGRYRLTERLFLQATLGGAFSTDNKVRDVDGQQQLLGGFNATTGLQVRVFRSLFMMPELAADWYKLFDPSAQLPREFYSASAGLTVGFSVEIGRGGSIEFGGTVRRYLPIGRAPATRAIVPSLNLGFAFY